LTRPSAPLRETEINTAIRSTSQIALRVVVGKVFESIIAEAVLKVLCTVTSRVDINDTSALKARFDAIHKMITAIADDGQELPPLTFTAAAMIKGLTVAKKNVDSSQVAFRLVGAAAMCVKFATWPMDDTFNKFVGDYRQLCGWAHPHRRHGKCKQDFW